MLQTEGWIVSAPGGDSVVSAHSLPDTAWPGLFPAVERERARAQELQQALKANPDYTDALAELGQCYLMKKEYEPAGKLWRRALELNPNHYAANFNLLPLYARAKDGREAAQAARFEEVKNLREEKAQEFLRMVEIHPYPIP